MSCRLLLQMIVVSVCHVAKFGFNLQLWLNGSGSCFRWTLSGAKEHRVQWGSWSPTARGGGVGENFAHFAAELRVSRMAENRDLKFCVHIEGGHRTFRILAPLVSREWLGLQTARLAVCVCMLHSMQPSPNYFGLLFINVFILWVLKRAKVHENHWYCICVWVCQFCHSLLMSTVSSLFSSLTCIPCMGL